MNTIKYKGESVWALPNTSYSSWSKTFAIGLIIIGLLAALMPVVATLASIWVFSWLLIVAGAFEIIHSIQMYKHNSFIWMFIIGLFTFLLGLLIWLSPLAGIASLSILIGVFLFMGGIARLFMAFDLHPEQNWLWVMVDGLISVALAILIAWGWPDGSVKIIGMLVGFSLMSAGIWRILFAKSATPYNHRLFDVVK